jgi:hypothetical protein
MKNIYRFLFFSIIISGTFSPIFSLDLKDRSIRRLWTLCKLEGQLSYEVFNLAIKGYNLTDSLKNKDIISIIDFSLPSTEKRFYVVDLKNRKLLYKCFVAHGKNTGENIAENFSNENGSLKSSLGFFVTAETYTGDNGYSMKLDGLEPGINDNARTREIVIHGADYVSQEFIDKEGRLGRSWGCPALPVELAKEIIDKISDGTLLFIYAKEYIYPFKR